MFRHIRNIGALDRSIRLIAGVILVPVGLLLLDGLGGGAAGLVTAAIGFVGIVTGATGFCPSYVPLGISTVKQGTPAQSH